MPASWSGLTNLQSLDMTSNRITGAISGCWLISATLRILCGQSGSYVISSATPVKQLLLLGQDITEPHMVCRVLARLVESSH